METINIHEAKTHLSRLVEKAAKGKTLEVQLFNLESDEPEQHNIADDHPDIVAQLEPFMIAGWRAPLPEQALRP